MFKERGRLKIAFLSDLKSYLGFTALAELTMRRIKETKWQISEEDKKRLELQYIEEEKLTNFIKSLSTETLRKAQYFGVLKKSKSD